MSRCSNAIPRLIAEGFAKKHQRAGFQKYLSDAMSESNKTIVCLCHTKDIYPQHADATLCEQLIAEYDIIGKQLYKLEIAWNSFTNKKPQPKD